MGRDHAAEVFAHRLRSLIEREGHSVRGFGKLADPGNPERGRRRLQRHLSGKHLPSKASRDSYAGALGVDPSELPLPEDEDGDDLESTLKAMTREHRAMGHGLARIGRAIEARS